MLVDNWQLDEWLAVDPCLYVGFSNFPKRQIKFAIIPTHWLPLLKMNSWSSHWPTIDVQWCSGLKILMFNQM